MGVEAVFCELRFPYSGWRDSPPADDWRGHATSRPRDEPQKDLFGPALEQIIHLKHPLVRLAGEIDWSFIERRGSTGFRPRPGQPPLAVRLVDVLLIVKHLHSLSDKALCAR